MNPSGVYKFVLFIIDQANISRDAISKLCCSSDSKILFATSKPDSTDSTKIFDFFIPISFDEYRNAALIYIGPHERLSLDLGSIFYHHECLRINSTFSTVFNGSISRELARSSSVSDSIASLANVGILVENPNNRLHVVTAQML